MDKPRHYRNNNKSETIYINNKFGEPMINPPCKVIDGKVIDATRGADGSWEWKD